MLQPAPYPPTLPRPDDIRVIFIGHCTLLVEIGGKRILTDPIFSDHASPVPGFGPRRFHPPGIRLTDLPPIDIILITHNHYDHLDDATIRYFGDRVAYVVPLGLKPWFAARGCSRVTELDWWEAAEYEGLCITATPCQHWSKRTPFDERQSLWAGYAVQFDDLRFLFIGDSGYYEGFKEIGERLGPFHVAALPIGAYEPAAIMAEVHMTPEEALQAFEDLGASILVPTHYACFPLTDEDVTEPPRRLFQAWRGRGYDLDHLWLLAPGQYRDMEHMIYIPTVHPVGCRRTPTPASGQFRRPEDYRTEWGIAICPHKGDMVDLESVGVRENLYEGDEGQTLSLHHVGCSGFGDHEECGTQSCPLRDPTFLRSYELHGIRTVEGGLEPFVEIDSPPESRWWQDKLIVERKEH